MSPILYRTPDFLSSSGWYSCFLLHVQFETKSAVDSNIVIKVSFEVIIFVTSKVFCLLTIRSV